MLGYIPMSLIAILCLGGCASPINTATSTDQAQVTHVIDGDTIEVVISGQSYMVRYIGIDAPEFFPDKEPYGEDARDKNRELVEGKRAILQKDISETDKYGRLLRYVYVDDLFVNAELVRLGYAEAVIYPPDMKYKKVLSELEREAREEERGLWDN
jgi:endonuclease YncB( thermonuclease family)